MRKLWWSLLAGLFLWAQDPSAAVELFRMGRYTEAYPLFKKAFERSRDYLWGSYAVECLLQADMASEYQRWIQAERQKNRLSPWGQAWELRRRTLMGDTVASPEWEKLVSRADLPLPTLEALAEVASRVWGQPPWQRAALYAARTRHPDPLAYAELLISSYEREGHWAAAWKEWLQWWSQRPLPAETLFAVLVRYKEAGLPSDSVELPLLHLWQERATPTLARILQRLYLVEGDLMEALRYARMAFRAENDCTPLYEIGWIAYERGFFSTAEEAFRLLLQAGEVCPYYAVAVSRYLEIEALLRQPIRALHMVDSLWKREPGNPALLIEKARWHLRLSQPDSVYTLLARLEPPTASLVAQKYLLLSDAALQKDDFLQARLYLLEIESRLPQSSWMSEAYFHLGRLAYFQGEFELAKTRLRLLKHNTQDDLSNDAIQLFWHIEDNLKPDTLPEPLRLFARAELYRLQGRSAEALRCLDSLEKTFKGHPITDDVLWQKAQYYLTAKDTATSRKYLELLADYPDSESLYRDDALYLLAQFARKPVEAARYYERLLRETPGSLYARIAQEKLRALTH